MVRNAGFSAFQQLRTIYLESGNKNKLFEKKFQKGSPRGSLNMCVKNGSKNAEKGGKYGANRLSSLVKWLSPGPIRLTVVGDRQR